MITRRQALAISSPGIVLLVGTLLWNAWEYRVELLDRVRAAARF